MRYAVSTTHTFHSSHRLESPILCSRLHGHEYHVCVTAGHEDLDPDGVPRGTIDLYRAVGVVAGELDYRDLGEMIPTIKTTPTGLAAWFFERLAAHFPAMTSVEVWHEFERGSVIK